YTYSVTVNGNAYSVTVGEEIEEGVNLGPDLEAILQALIGKIQSGELGVTATAGLNDGDWLVTIYTDGIDVSDLSVEGPVDVDGAIDPDPVDALDPVAIAPVAQVTVITFEEIPV